MKSLFVIAFLLLSVPSDASDRLAAIPKHFLGTWGSNRANCGSANDDLSLQIQETKISYHNSSGPLKAIVSHGHHELALIAELSGEGQTWLASEQFILSRNGDRLMSQMPPKTVRYRCPR